MGVVRTDDIVSRALHVQRVRQNRETESISKHRVACLVECCYVQGWATSISQARWLWVRHPFRILPLTIRSFRVRCEMDYLLDADERIMFGHYELVSQ